MFITFILTHGNQEVFNQTWEFSDDTCIKHLDGVAEQLRDQYFQFAEYNWYEIEESEVDFSKLIK